MEIYKINVLILQTNWL